MTELTFSGRSDDGARLVLVDETGQEFTLAVDDRLRREVGGEPDSPGQLEVQMEQSLRPRDIQARIRAGESPEVVARIAGSSVEKIMPFAAPVLAERAHVAQRAQLSSVRRRSGDSGARTLGEAVAAQLRGHNVDPDSVEWDAWRREDGRWTLTGSCVVAGTGREATFSFDVRGNFVTLDDDDARWLVGEVSRTEEPPPSDDELSRRRRLSAVSSEELPLGTDAIEMVAGDDADDDVSPTETTAEIRTGGSARAADSTHRDADLLGADQPLDAFLEPDAGSDAGPEAGSDAGTQARGASDERVEPVAEKEPEPEQPASRRAKRRGRASVPSWDEIMFGGGKGE